jgi:hypothetical protein
MLVTETVLRGIIRDVLLAESIQNTHGYTVSDLYDVKWNADKMGIPKRANPFVGSSAAFDDWYNDGEMTKEVLLIINRDTPFEKKILLRNDVFFKEGSFVIIPSLWAMGKKKVFQIAPPGIYQASAERIPGSGRLDSVPLVDLKDPSNPGAPATEKVGIAFLRNVGGPRAELSDAVANAKEHMGELTRAERLGLPEPEAAPRGVIRRRAGEPMPERPVARPAASRPMSPEEREMLLGRRRE